MKTRSPSLARRRRTLAERRWLPLDRSCKRSAPDSSVWVDSDCVQRSSLNKLAGISLVRTSFRRTWTSINDKTLRSSEPEVEEALRTSKLLRATLSLREVIDHADIVFTLHADIMAKSLLDQGLYEYKISDVAYKPNCPVDIIEESQPLEIAKRLVRAGKKVTISDRAAIVHLVRRTYGRLFDYEICDAAARGIAPIPDTTMGNPLSSYTK